MPPVLEVTGLWQSFRPKTRHGGRRSGGQRKWALRDVNLVVDPGEMVGIVGANGSGKSTLLRTVAGVYRPERGDVTVRGRVAHLLDLETGVNRDLTARENLHISGVLLGMSRAEIRQRYRSIVDFSGLDSTVMQQPLSGFSAGMELRLTLSVILNSDPSLLLIDEVLAVGDKDFRQQCHARLDELRARGCAVLMVSHDLEMIDTRSSRVVLLDRGDIKFTGPPAEALALWRSSPPAPAGAGGAAPPAATAAQAVADDTGHTGEGPAPAGGGDGRRSPLRVVFIIHTLDGGGAQRQLTNLAVGLRRRGDDILVLSHLPGGMFSDALTAQGVQVGSIDKTSRVDLRYLARLRRQALRHAPDVVACYLTDSNVMGLALKATAPRVPVVLGIRNESPYREADTRMGRLMPRLERRLSRFSAAVVVNSRRGERYLLDHGYRADRVRQIDNGIDTVAFAPDPAKRASTRHAWGIDDDQILIGLVGRQDPQKAIPVFLEAARTIADRLPSARFVTIGKEQWPDYTRDLVERSQALGLVPPLLEWLTTFPDMPAAYNAFDLVVSTSRREGFANNIAEALACGTPCVVTDVGDSARIVGDERWVVPVDDPVRMAQACLTALEHEFQPEKLRASVLDFGLDTMVEETRAVYVDAATPRRSRRPRRRR